MRLWGNKLRVLCSTKIDEDGRKKIFDILSGSEAIDIDCADYYTLLDDKGYIFTEQTPFDVKKMLKRRSKKIKNRYVYKKRLLGKLYKFCETNNIMIRFWENAIICGYRHDSLADSLTVFC